MLAPYNTGSDSSPSNSNSNFIPQSPPRKKRRLAKETKQQNLPKSDSPNFAFQNVNGEIKLVVVPTTECINITAEDDSKSSAKVSYIDLRSSDEDINEKSNKTNIIKHCIDLLSSDSCNNSKDGDKHKKTDDDSDNKSDIECHSFLNKPIMNDASDSIYEFFKDIIHKYKSDPNILSKIEIEGRIGMLLKKRPPKQAKHRNNRYLRVSDDIFGGTKNNTNAIHVYKTKQKGSRFDSDVKKQTFYYFKTVMNGLYINSEILNKNERMEINQNVLYPRMSFRSSRKIISKYNNGVRQIEDITHENEINNRKKRGQKQRIGNMDICFNFEESDYDIRINAAIERDESEMKDNGKCAFSYKGLRCIRCKEIVEYKWDEMFKIELSVVHSYNRNLFDGKFIQTLRRNLLNGEKLPMTQDCKQREYQIEIEIIDFHTFALKTNRQLKQLSTWFSSMCLQIAKLLGYVNDFAKKTNRLPTIAQWDIDKISKEKAQHEILPLYQNPYYKNHYYHNVIHKQSIGKNKERKRDLVQCEENKYK